MAALLVIAFLLVLTSLIFALRQHSKEERYTISEHAAGGRLTYLVFALSLTLCGGAILAYLLTISSRFGVSPWFEILLAASLICLIATAWIPDTGMSRRGLIHKIASFSLALTMTGITACIGVFLFTYWPLRLFALMAVIWFLVSLALYFFIRSSRRYFPTFQLINVVVFFIVVLLTTA